MVTNPGLSEEHELLRKAKKGDEASFEKLIQAHQRRVYNLAFRMMGNPDDAEEMAQEAFLKAFRAIGTFKEEAAFGTWMYRITSNVCLDALRKRKNNKHVISIDADYETEKSTMRFEIADDGPGPVELTEQKELSRMINKAIAQLPEDHRMVILLRDVQGLSYEEISETIQCPAGTVKSRINRARQGLRQILSPMMELL